MYLYLLLFKYEGFPVIIFIDFLLNCTVVREHTLTISIIWNLLRLALWPSIWSVEDYIFQRWPQQYPNATYPFTMWLCHCPIKGRVYVFIPFNLGRPVTNQDKIAVLAAFASSFLEDGHHVRRLTTLRPPSCERLKPCGKTWRMRYIEKRKRGQGAPRCQDMWLKEPSWISVCSHIGDAKWKPPIWAQSTHRTLKDNNNKDNNNNKLLGIPWQFSG